MKHSLASLAGAWALEAAHASAVFCRAACCLLLATGCEQSTEEKAKWTEERRVHCLEHLCEGETPPQPNTTETTVLKLNGEWFVGPAAYFSSGINGASFMWWEHGPLSKQTSLPPELLAMAAEGKSDEFSIVIFLRNHDGRNLGPSRYERLRQAEREGRLLSKESPLVGLEVWRIKEPGIAITAVWYVATSYVVDDPTGAVLRCSKELGVDFCAAGFTWRPGIAVDMRLSGRHGHDWPAIYQETQRILNLLKKI